MDDRSFFDNLALTWDDNEILSTPEKVAEILDQMDIKAGEEVLDLGTGTGVLIPYIAKRVGEKGKITAVDYSQGMLNRAKTKFSNIVPVPEFLNLDFENENLEGEYDHIILYCVFPHLHSPIETLRWLRSVNLKENGKIWIAFPCNADFINNIHKEKHSESDRLKNPEELVEMLKEHNFNAQIKADDEHSYIVKISR